MRQKKFIIAAALIGLGSGFSTVNGSIVGPYATDANTLHLYHMDGAGVPMVDSAGTLDLNGPTSNTTTTTPAGFLAPTFGAAAFSGFGTSADFTAQALSTVSSGNPPAVAPHRPILTAVAGLSNTESTATGDNVNFSFADPTTGAFTFEAVVKLGFDPSSTTYRNTAPTASPGSNAGSYPMQIISGDNDNGTAASRTWQFRLLQKGVGAAANVGTGAAASTVRLEFNNIGVGSQLVVAIPEVGDNAINNSDWFHLAVAYNGTANTAGNFTFYWTKMDPTVTLANALGSGNMTADLNSALIPDFAIGNEARDAGTGAGEGESFVGFIDEVRISSIARAAGDMQFVPEPASLGLLSLGALALVRRRRQA